MTQVTLTQNNYRSGPISNLLILRTTYFNHGLGSWMLDLDLNVTEFESFVRFE